jgi:hypothetical protein
MKNTLKNTLILSVLLLAASMSFGQTALTQTTLSAAVNSTSQTQFTVASATGITATNTLLYVMDGTSANSESVFVNSVSGTTIGVTRGYNGTKASRHISGAIVWAGPPNAFHATDPSGQVSTVGSTAACTNEQFSPYINIQLGHVWLCSTITLSWVPGFFNTSAPPGVTVAVASVAGATSPSGPLFHVTGTNAITAWGTSTTVTTGGMGGSHTSTMGAPFCVIPDAIFTTTATNNIGLASTAVVNKLLCYTFDQTSKVYIPTY